MASFPAYELERRVSKKPERFGTGALEGVAAPEAANNATANAAFVPTLTLGIPGSETTAVLLGAFLIFGPQPGALLFTQQPALTWNTRCVCPSTEACRRSRDDSPKRHQVSAGAAVAVRSPRH